VQYLRLTPRSGPSQTVNRWRVTCQGADLTEWSDHFGNICHTLVLTRPRERLSLDVSGDVKTIETNGIIPLGLTALPPAVYLRETSYTISDTRLRKFAAQFRAAFKADRVAGLHELMLAINAEVVYTEGGSDVHTTAAEALTDGKGVCQDHAHVFIAVCRILGVPARYVSGYLASGDGAEDHGASHAWAEALVPDLGWVSFDAANGVSATSAYVRTAVGLDYGDAGPVRGVRTGGGEEAMTVTIALNSRQ
jgi:transglutaminase-like putative cysteine protease